MTAPFTIQPIITMEANDSASDNYLDSLGVENRKIFVVQITPGGKIIKNHKIKLETNYLNRSGGHAHTNTNTIRPHNTERVRRQNYGSFYSYNSGNFSSDSLHGMKYENSIDDTIFVFEYVASIWGDSMKIYLKSLENGLLEKDSITIIERIPALVSLGEGTDYRLVGGTSSHHGPTAYTQEDKNHFGTDRTIANIVRIANDWHRDFPNEMILHINDISLPFGGKFDINGRWYWKHQTHREGKDVDVRTEINMWRVNRDSTNVSEYHRQGVWIRNPREEFINNYNQNNGKYHLSNNPNSSLDGNSEFEEMCEEHDGTADIHGRHSINEHYHIDFNN
jgi:hypothetical protein